MKQAIHHFPISTKGRGLVEVTPLVAGWLAARNFPRAGLPAEAVTGHNLEPRDVLQLLE